MMDSAAWLKLREALNGRRDAIVDSWYNAIARICYPSRDPAQVRHCLVELAGQVITLLCAEPFDHDGSQAFGASLVNLSIEPEVLDQTQKVLTQQLLAGLSADQIVTLQPRLAELFGGVGAGFFRQARKRILTEQEQIRRALTSELRHQGAALRKLYDELEQRVQTRTAELTAANAQLEREIAERLQAEQGQSRALAKALQVTHELRESEARYRSLFEDSPIPLWEADLSQVKAHFDDLRAAGVTDLRSYFHNHPEAAAHCAELVRLLNVNKASLALIGARDKDEILPCLSRIFTGESLEVFREGLIALADGEQRFQSEMIIRTFTGEEKIVAIQLGVASGYQDSLGKVLASLRDVTGRKRAEEVLKKHQEQLEESVKERTAELTAAIEQAEEARRVAEAAAESAAAANRAKSAFLANMSHELRTPLNAILGYAQILQRRPLDPDVIKGLQIVQQSGEQLLTLITDILDIAEIETGRMDLHPVSINFPNFLEIIAGIIRLRAHAKRLTFSFEKQIILPLLVEADEMRLRQILLSLLGNAVKFTDEGQVTFRVSSARSRVSSEEPGTRNSKLEAWLRFEVEDTGPGIPPDQLEQILQPFEQGGLVTRRGEGTGLGLAISRQLVQLMGGELHVESLSVPPAREGESKGGAGPGSRFWFEIALPVAKAVVEAAPSLERAVAGYQGPRRVVLVVDDISSNRMMMVDLLMPLGFDVIEAVDGQQAIHMARELRPDLILMDRWMPAMDGFEAVQQMRQIPELGRVPTIVISSSVSAEDQVRSREVGIDAFLPKPVNWPRLAALLEEHLKLDWIYEEQGSEEREALGESLPSGPLPGRSSASPAPPPEEMTILHNLALMGDIQALRERAAHIETLGEQYSAFANRLRALAEGFEEREILAWVEQCMSMKKNE